MPSGAFFSDENHHLWKQECKNVVKAHKFKLFKQQLWGEDVFTGSDNQIKASTKDIYGPNWWISAPFQSGEYVIQ